MDNRRFDITSTGDLALVMAVAFGMRKATHWKEVRGDLGPTLILLWGADTGATMLMVPMAGDDAHKVIEQWLARQDYGPAPDHDGDNRPGYRVFNGEWGHVLGHRYAICGVQPVWAMFGK